MLFFDTEARKILDTSKPQNLMEQVTISPLPRTPHFKPDTRFFNTLFTRDAKYLPIGPEFSPFYFVRHYLGKGKGEIILENTFKTTLDIEDYIVKKVFSNIQGCYFSDITRLKEELYNRGMIKAQNPLLPDFQEMCCKLLKTRSSTSLFLVLLKIGIVQRYQSC